MGEVVTVAFDIVYSSKQSVGFTHVYYACSVVEHSRQLKVGSMSCAQRFGEAIQFHRFILLNTDYYRKLGVTSACPEKLCAYTRAPF